MHSDMLYWLREIWLQQPNHVDMLSHLEAHETCSLAYMHWDISSLFALASTSTHSLSSFACTHVHKKIKNSHTFLSRTHAQTKHPPVEGQIEVFTEVFKGKLNWGRWTFILHYLIPAVASFTQDSHWHTRHTLTHTQIEGTLDACSGIYLAGTKITNFRY